MSEQCCWLFGYGNLCPHEDPAARIRRMMDELPARADDGPTAPTPAAGRTALRLIACTSVRPDEFTPTNANGLYLVWHRWQVPYRYEACVEIAADGSVTEVYLWDRAGGDSGEHLTPTDAQVLDLITFALEHAS